MKRAFDLIIAAAALVVLSPLFLLAGMLVWLSLGWPILFRQQRPGLGGTPFTLYKFRTMRHEVSPAGRLLADEERLNLVGRFLRSSSLDELPELFNVLKGDMSLVGPRPLLMEYLDYYNAHEARRHEVRPGITGWAQINGRNALSWEEKFDYDVWYVDNQSLWLDIKILVLTIFHVFRPKGVSHSGYATMPRLSDIRKGRRK